eukprot:TRINITY_DN665_c9_g1_i1.p1 TRINITY_DN665_c9_g1~~TRINITY_DN665_c9_g1_i1.p1  ORF type:complete len:699 (+),score=135.20 TRINITY_DN665_c9_g1_i1:68-2164(+)
MDASCGDRPSPDLDSKRGDAVDKQIPDQQEEAEDAAKGRPLLWCVTKRVLCPNDTPEERVRKMVWIPIVVIMLVVAIGLRLFTQDLLGAYEISVTGGLLCCVVGFVYPLATKRLPIELVEALFLLLTLFAILGDWDNAAEMDFRAWPLVILINDMLLVQGVEWWVLRSTVSMTVVWFAVSSAEDAFRLGLYDIEDWTEGSPEQLRERTQCADPPCAIGALEGLVKFMYFTATLVIDFMATRSFAAGQRKEQQRVQASVQTAEQVAEHLVQFDLAAASRALESADIPEGLRSGFIGLLANLGRYKPYLPQSCFEQDEASEEGSEEASGSGGDVDAAQGSIELVAPDQMRMGSEVDVPAPPASPRLLSGSPRGRQASWRRRMTISSETSRLSGSLSHSARHDISQVAEKKQMHHATQRRMSLLCRNAVAYLATIAQWDTKRVAERQSEEIEVFCSNVSLQKGVVAELNGDHQCATFGAARLLSGQHRQAAVLCAAGLQGLSSERNACATRGFCETAEEHTAAVCSGTALCGDYGTAAVRRFMVIGAVGAFAPVVERAAAGWRVSVLIDESTNENVSTAWNCRLRKLVVHPKSGPKALGLWEVLGARRGQDNGPAEWMYEMDSLEANPWQTYNDLLRMWIANGPDTAQEWAAARETADKGPASDAVSTLRTAITAGEDPPILTVPEAAGLGLPAPLRSAAQ